AVGRCHRIETGGFLVLDRHRQAKARQRLGASSLGTAVDYLQELERREPEGRRGELMNAVKQVIFP
ncbi:MAG: hypothetical protein ACXWUS_13325, partial [Burkholderiales bacterium]